MSTVDKNQISDAMKAEMLLAGVDLASDNKTYLLMGDESFQEAGSVGQNIELLPIDKAIEQIPEVANDYLWKLVSADKDDFTKEVAAETQGGYFIRVKKNHKETEPLQACFYIKESYYKQKVHNLIVLEEGAELHIINGCVSSHDSSEAQHLSITEIYVGKGAKLSYTMIHNWNESTKVFPRSAVVVEEDGEFSSNYIALKPTKIVQSYPMVTVHKNGQAALNSVIFSYTDSVYDVGGGIILAGEGARGEVVSRTVSSGGEIIARGDIQAEVNGTFGHMECSSLMLTDEGMVQAIPELGSKAKNVTLSHEAMVGKIADGEVYYLMSRGLSEEQAVSLIVRGFLNIDIKGLPQAIKDQISATLNMLDSEYAL